MTFRISGLDPAPFVPLYGLSDRELMTRGARRMIVDAAPGYPDRIELRDLDVGERVLLVNHVHHDVAGPYRAAHAIFVREGATEPRVLEGVVPEVIRRRPISLRAFDTRDDMIDAALLDGEAVAAAIVRMFADPRVAFLHAHYAVRGCFAARVDRA